MKAFRNKKTSRLGERQLGNDADVLIRNAKVSGFKDDEISIIDISLADYESEIRLQNIADRKPKQDKIDAQKLAIRTKLKSGNTLDDKDIDFLLDKKVFTVAHI